MSEVTPERLNPFLRAHFGAGETRLTRIGGGQSNPTFIVDHGDRRMVLRKQPAGEILKGAHAIDREFRVMRALADTDVPVPRALRFHDDPALLGTYPEELREVFGEAWPDWPADEVAALKQPIDFLGLNYYTRAVVRHDAKAWPVPATPQRQPGGIYTETGWELHPQSLADTLVWMHERYGGLPLYVTATCQFGRWDDPERRSGAEGLVLQQGALIQIYIVLTVACASAYFALGMNGFEAVVHALTTVSTGGFSSSDASFAKFNHSAEVVAIVFMLLASLPFIRFVQVMHGDMKPLWRDPQVRAFS